MVSRRRLASKEECPWRHVGLAISANPVVKDDYAQRIEQLPFVFMNAFNLAIKNGLRVDRLSRTRFEPIGKFALGLPLGVANRIAKGLFILERPELVQLAEIG